jgi:hypothetical protein
VLEDTSVPTYAYLKAGERLDSVNKYRRLYAKLIEMGYERVYYYRKGHLKEKDLTYNHAY